MENSQENLEAFDMAASPPVVEEQPQEAAEPAAEEEKQKEPESPAEFLERFPASPAAEQVEAWKTQHGDVLMSLLGDDEVFLFRPITRNEFLNLQQFMAQSKEEIPQAQVEEKICSACLLWASEAAQRSLDIKAGTYPTLHEQILQQSNFIAAGAVGQFVHKL